LWLGLDGARPDEFFKLKRLDHEIIATSRSGYPAVLCEDRCGQRDNLESDQLLANWKLPPSTSSA